MKQERSSQTRSIFLQFFGDKYNFLILNQKLPLRSSW